MLCIRIGTFIIMKIQVPGTYCFVLLLFAAVLFHSCNKGPSIPMPCNDLITHLFNPTRIISVPCANMFVDSVAIDTIDVDDDGLGDLRITYSAHVVFPGGGGSYWTCWGNGFVSGLDSTEIIQHQRCSGSCNGPFNVNDTLVPADATALFAELHSINVLSCNCYHTPGHIGFIKHVNGHPHCGYLELTDTGSEINVARTVFATCADRPLVIEQ